MSKNVSWERFKALRFVAADLGLSLDLSRVRRGDAVSGELDSLTERALDEMTSLEAGDRVNRSEDRQVGHYWLRAPDRAPDESTRNWIVDVRRAVSAFADEVHSGAVAPEKAPAFTHLLVIGIGGSVLGPQLVHDVLSRTGDPLRTVFLDNTDPDGFDRVFDELGDDLVRTLTLVISKSGRTPETRNGMVEVRARYTARGLDFPRHAVAVTGPYSELDRLAVSEGWIRRFPMADWIGGRTSWSSAVGLLPAALAGFDLEAMLRGAAAMDELTRLREIAQNPAALLARAWHVETGGRGDRQMVMLPYRDRLMSLSRYLQQLVMESLGKKHDRAGRVVHQGLTVFGNKGSTDQHAYVQQLRDGRDDFFVTFVQVLEERAGTGPEFEPGVTSGDYLAGFLLGTRQALWDEGRGSILLTLRALDAVTLGAVLALFERAVGLYASMIDVNAYDQPGVEAGKKAASAILDLQRRIREHLQTAGAGGLTAEEIARALGADPETVFLILERLVVSHARGIRLCAGDGPHDARYAVDSRSQPR